MVAAMCAWSIVSVAGLPPSTSVRLTLLGPPVRLRAARVAFMKKPVGRPIETDAGSARNHQSMGLLPGQAPLAGSRLASRTPRVKGTDATPVRSESPMNWVITLTVPLFTSVVSVGLSCPIAVLVSAWVPRRLVAGMQPSAAGAAVPAMATAFIRVTTS